MATYQYSKPYSAAPVGGPAIVWCIGDSLTHLPGWRQALFAAMTAAGANPSFVGSQLNANDVPPTTGAGVGHGGLDGASGVNWVASYFATYSAALSPTVPHYILISVGTNDSQSAAPTFCTLMDLASVAFPKANIFFATAPRTKSGVGATQAAAVRLEVAARAMKQNVRLVDQYAESGLVAGDFTDEQHPDSTGQAKMGALWVRAISQIIP